MFALPAGLGPLVTVDIFRPYVGADFLANTQPQPVKITLAKVSDLRTPSWLERQSFNLLFTTPLNVLLIAGLYELTAPDGAGPWTVHLNPIMHPPTHRVYQGLFH